MVILDLLDLISEYDESSIDFVELVPIELVAQLFAAQAECVPPRMFAEHEFGIRHSDRLRSHDFVGQRILEHAVLMNAGFMGKGVAADNCLVGLDRDSCDLTERLACRKQLFTYNPGLVGEPIGTY